jgi:hypothetical protein
MKILKNKNGIARPLLQTTGTALLLFALTGTTVRAEPHLTICERPAEAGQVLFQHASSAIGIQAFAPDSDPSWTADPVGTANWSVVAADSGQTLLYSRDNNALALCKLNAEGTPIEFLRLNCDISEYAPVALAGSRVLVQGEETGCLQELEFNDAGEETGRRIIWAESLGWIVRGVDSNRLLLEHAETGDVAIWAANPKAPLFNPYKTFTLPSGWSACDFSEDFVLIQDALSGAVSLVELGEGYRPDKFIELAANGNGWQAVALSL